MTSEHNIKVFAYDQYKAVSDYRDAELRIMRKNLHKQLLCDSPELAETRERMLEKQRQHHTSHYQHIPFIIQNIQVRESSRLYIYIYIHLHICSYIYLCGYCL